MSMASAAIERERLAALLRDMVNIYSPTGKEEELVDFLQAYLQAAGLPVERQPVDETRCNLLVRNGTAAPGTLFLGHVDTVPAFDFEEYSFSMRNGQCRGLGTADMKGGCAALIEAFVAAAHSGTLPSSAVLALVVGEEDVGDGTQALLRQHRFAQAVVAEPTDLKPCLEHYGYVEMEVHAFGYRRHAAMSGRDTNAIRALLRLLIQLEERVENDNPGTVLNIRDLHSSESGFAVPDRCAASVDLHLPPAVAAGSYAQSLRAFAEQELERSGASRHEIEFATLADGFRVDPLSPLPQQLLHVFMAEQRTWTPDSFQSHSDASLLRDAGCPSVVLGPGLLAKAHTRDESVELEQVQTAARLYARLLDRLE